MSEQNSVVFAEVTKENAIEWVNTNIDLEKLITEVNKYAQNDDYLNENNDYQYWCFTMVSSHYGSYTSFTALKCFDVIPHDTEFENMTVDQKTWHYTELDNVEGFFSNVLNELVKERVKGSFYFGFHEHDGSYGLYYVEEKEGEGEEE